MPAFVRARRALLNSPPKYDWHVDSVRGNDNRSGKTPQKAFKTIAALVAAGISAGDKVGLARGSHWREQLDISANNVTIKAYGSGDKPILDASNVAVNASFSKTVGQTNVYEISITPDWAGAGTDWLNAWEDDAFLTRATNVANCDATPGSYYPSGGAGAITLYVHASDSSDVTANGKVYEHSQRSFGLTTNDALYPVVDGIVTKKQLDTGGSFKLGRFGTAKNCEFLQGSSHNALIRTGATVDGCTVRDAYHTLNCLMLVYNEATPSNEGITVRNTAFSFSSTSEPAYARSFGMNGHNNAAGSFGTITVENCTFSTLLAAVSTFNDATEIQFTNCAMTNLKFGYTTPFTATPGGVTITGGTWNSNVADHRVLNIDTANAAYSVSGLNCVFRGTYSGGYVRIAAAATITITGSTFDNQNADNMIAVTCNNASANITLNQNVYTGSNTWLYIYYWEAGAAGMTWASDYNTFGPNFRMGIFTDTYTDLATYQTATSQDAHST